MKVYRLENEDGLGPFTAEAGSIQALYAFWENKPTQDEFSFTDLIVMREKKYRFGCDSMEQLQDYFGVLFFPLLDDGFRVREYEASHVIYSKSGQQCAFIGS